MIRGWDGGGDTGWRLGGVGGEHWRLCGAASYLFFPNADSRRTPSSTSNSTSLFVVVAWTLNSSGADVSRLSRVHVVVWCGRVGSVGRGAISFWEEMLHFQDSWLYSASEIRIIFQPFSWLISLTQISEIFLTSRGDEANTLRLLRNDTFLSIIVLSSFENFRRYVLSASESALSDIVWTQQ